MTDRSQLDVERAERLARLRDRRTDSPPATGTASPMAEPALPPPTATTAAGPRAGQARSARRRSPATNAKIITVGASTTALLGMMAGYGIADGTTSGASVEAAPDVQAPPATIPPAAPTAAPTPTAPPQVIVVLVDAATGRPISTTLSADEDAVGQVLDTVPSAAPVTTPPDTAAPAPVQVPTAVDLAVPAPPAPQPQTAPSPAPTPAPQPQATSSGS